MATTITLDPVTRLEGHLKIQVTVAPVNGQNQVTSAQATGTMYRGIERILQGRAPADAAHITERICGVCPVAHGRAAVEALEDAANLTIPANARIMRNLVQGANFVQSHILHFYHLALLDFVDGPNMPPWQPGWTTDKRLNSSALVSHYVTALEMRRKAHEIGALYGGRMPAPPAFIPGGMTTTPRRARVTQFKAGLSTLISFIKGTYIPDVRAVAAAYSDYYKIGRGRGALLAYGVFDLNSTGTSKFLKRGRVTHGATTVQGVDLAGITEQVTHSWYTDACNDRPPRAGATLPQYPKTGAYSWLKAPRYVNYPYEVGALARMWINGNYRRGISVMDRHLARAAECLKIAEAMMTWVGQLSSAGAYKRWRTPATATGIGLTEAPRGALGHWISITGSRIHRYQIVTPTCWNASPRDTAGRNGPIEAALVGTPVQNIDEPIEVLRVIHSFDPCLSCAVHVMRPDEDKKIYALGHYHEVQTACAV